MTRTAQQEADAREMNPDVLIRVRDTDMVRRSALIVCMKLIEAVRSNECTPQMLSHVEQKLDAALGLDGISPSDPNRARTLRRRALREMRERGA